MLRIVFMGTPEFAVPSLEQIVSKGHKVVAVVTPPDKPAGRGRKLTPCAVKIAAISLNLPVLQPEKLRDQEFIQTLTELNPDVMVVVAFRMLPKVVWTIPNKGAFNLHSSLLPDYRGAAPMNHAIINGETESGVTTFLLDEQIDTGKILFTEKVHISKTMNVGELHDILMIKGAELVIHTLEALEKGIYEPLPQPTKIRNPKTAPKFIKEDLQIKWDSPAHEIYNFIRGLSPNPTAFTSFISPEGKRFPIKIYQSQISNIEVAKGVIFTDNKKVLVVGCGSGAIQIKEIQLSGKKKMSVDEFLRGFPLSHKWSV